MADSFSSHTLPESSSHTLPENSSHRQPELSALRKKLLKAVAAATAGCGARRLLVGLSGGADSVALLRLLLSLPEKERPVIKAVHCNFHLRGEESERDERFCRELCRRSGVELECAQFDAASYAAENGISIEMACRRLRYDFFFSLMQAEGWQRIAVAHHADDNAETLLLNLMTGSGIRGLKGMVEDTGKILRPLLTVTRATLREYLKEIGQDYIEDSSNDSTDYRRNFLRKEVIPLLETRWPAAARSIARSASILSREMRLAYPDEGGDEESEPGEYPRLSRVRIRASADPESTVFNFIRRFGGNPAQAREIAACVVRTDSDTASGQWWRLPDGARISLERDHIEVLPEVCRLAEVDCRETVLSESVWEEIKSNRNPDVAWFPFPLSRYTVRRAATGDRLRPAGMKGSVKVSKLMKDARFSRRRKEETPVITRISDEGKEEIVWAAGLRRSSLDAIPHDAVKAYRYRVLHTEFETLHPNRRKDSAQESFASTIHKIHKKNDSQEQIIR